MLKSIRLTKTLKTFEHLPIRLFGQKHPGLSDNYIFPDSVNDPLIFLMFFLENHHLGEMLILAFLLNSTDESIIHSALSKSSSAATERSGIAIWWSAWFGIFLVFQRPWQADGKRALEHSLDILKLHPISH
jgi:hypothetical protein